MHRPQIAPIRLSALLKMVAVAGVGLLIPRSTNRGTERPRSDLRRYDPLRPEQNNPEQPPSNSTWSDQSPRETPPDP